MALTRNAAIEELFEAGWEQKDIARVLKLSEVTISRYVNKKNLRQKRSAHSLARKTATENALFAYEHQSTIVYRMAQKLKEDLPEDASIDQLKAALIPKGEIDALQKLATTIRTKETEWSDVVKIIREFTSYLKDRNLELAQDIIDPADDYINEKRRLIS